MDVFAHAFYVGLVGSRRLVTLAVFVLLVVTAVETLVAQLELLVSENELVTTLLL